jgi:hypothetical protein
MVENVMMDICWPLFLGHPCRILYGRFGSPILAQSKIRFLYIDSFVVFAARLLGGFWLGPFLAILLADKSGHALYGHPIDHI